MNTEPILHPVEVTEPQPENLEIAADWDIQPGDQDADNVVETGSIEELRNDLELAHKALRKIMHIHPTQFPGGPNNKNFGNKFLLCFGRAQEAARKEVVAQMGREMEREHRAHEETEITEDNTDGKD